MACSAKPVSKSQTSYSNANSNSNNNNNNNHALIQGRPQHIAARVLMKALYGARLARFDLLRAICYLTTFISTWDAVCDTKLHRLMCSINSTIGLNMVGWVGDPVSDVSSLLFADADFAGCLKTARSTPGIYLGLYGPSTRFPLQAQSTRQGRVSHSTTGSEIVAADMALRTIGIPALELWGVVLNRLDCKITFHEDNPAMIKVMESGKPNYDTCRSNSQSFNCMASRRCQRSLA